MAKSIKDCLRVQQIKTKPRAALDKKRQGCCPGGKDGEEYSDSVLGCIDLRFCAEGESDVASPSNGGMSKELEDNALPECNITVTYGFVQVEEEDRLSRPNPYDYNYPNGQWVVFTIRGTNEAGTGFTLHLQTNASDGGISGSASALLMREKGGKLFQH